VGGKANEVRRLAKPMVLKNPKKLLPLH